MMKRFAQFGSVVALSLLLFVGAAASQPDEPASPDEDTVAAMPAPQPMDYRAAGSLFAAALGGAGMTWVARRTLKTKGNANMMLSGVFSVIAGAGAASLSGLSWRDALAMSVVGWLGQQGVYKTAKHRPSNSG